MSIVHVVDEDAMVRDTTAALLTVLERDPALWTSSGQFLARANPRPDECILLDARMTGLGGIETIGRLAAWGVVTPVVVMADKDKNWAEAEFLARGAVCVLGKPFTLGELRNALATAEAASSRIGGRRTGFEPKRSVKA
jgi:FixJ family two-component response regulator